LTRPDVDPKRLAVAGNSGGGTQAAYLAMLEPRLAAAAPSCYLTSWESMSMKLGPQDSEQNFHGFISSGLDFGDFLIALLWEAHKDDDGDAGLLSIEGAGHVPGGGGALTGARTRSVCSSSTINMGGQASARGHVSMV
jgi:hypothetical protein